MPCSTGRLHRFANEILFAIMVPENDFKLVLFFNATVTLATALVAMIATWPFQGLFNSWVYVDGSTTTYKDYHQMAWLDMANWALFYMNLQCFQVDDYATHQAIFKVNILIMLLWDPKTC